MHGLRLVVVSFLLIVLASCGSGKLQTVKVRGKVTLDDKPLPEGVIVFTKDGEIPRELPIAKGTYEGDVVVGMNHIQFAVYRKHAAPQGGGPGADSPSLENILPSRYNQESTESREVKADGPNQFDFQLKSK